LEHFENIITGFSNDEYAKIETDLHTYTNDYRDGTSYKDEYYSDAVTAFCFITGVCVSSDVYDFFGESSIPVLYFPT